MCGGRLNGADSRSEQDRHDVGSVRGVLATADILLPRINGAVVIKVHERNTSRDLEGAVAEIVEVLLAGSRTRGEDPCARPRGHVHIDCGSSRVLRERIRVELRTGVGDRRPRHERVAPITSAHGSGGQLDRHVDGVAHFNSKGKAGRIRDELK